MRDERTLVEFPREVLEGSIPTRFEAVVRRYPNRPAVKSGDLVLGYEALNRAANRVARAVLATGGDPARPVALLLERDAPLAAAILGVLKAGRIVVCVDPAFPLERIRQILDDAQASFLIAGDHSAGLAGQVARPGVSWMRMEPLEGGDPANNPGRPVPPDAAACIIYTSGSTGRPKGILYSHRSGLHDVLLRSAVMSLGPGDRLAWVHSPSFAASMQDLLCAVLNGGAILPFDPQREGAARLGHWLQEEAITVFHAVPVLFRDVAETFMPPDPCPQLRLVRLSGDRVSPRDVELFQERFGPACRLLITLATTETGFFRYYFIDRAAPFNEGAVPVGYAVPDKEVLLLDDEGNPVGPDTIGEIAVKSRYLSLGYWRQPDRTQAAFRPTPDGGAARIYRTGDLGRLRPDDCLEILGRKDFQVKIRGVRIEPAEVEAALLEDGSIRDAVVMAREDRPGERRLVGYLVVREGRGPTLTALRRRLSERFPKAMIPTAFLILPALPLTANGKVDRRALPPPTSDRPDLETAFVPPRTHVEDTVGAIWMKVLGLDRVGVYDGFLELGGNSLLAFRIIARVLAAFHVEPPLRALLESATVAAMAALIVQRQAEAAGSAVAGRALAEIEGLPEDQVERVLRAETALAEKPPDSTA